MLTRLGIRTVLLVAVGAVQKHAWPCLSHLSHLSVAQSSCGKAERDGCMHGLSVSHRAVLRMVLDWRDDRSECDGVDLC